MWNGIGGKTAESTGLFPDRVAPAGLRRAIVLLAAWLVAAAASARAPQVVDVPTRPGVTQRFLYVPAKAPVAAAILFAGGHGGLEIRPDGEIGWGRGNFLVRTRALFAERGISVAVIDAPSDRQADPWLGGFRQTREHAADAAAVVEWLRAETTLPVWLVGTSRGTQSVAYLALASIGADGLVLTSTILVDPRGRPVPAMPVERIAVPTLVVHHRDDRCSVTPYSQASALAARLTSSPRKAFLTFDGGTDRGDACEAAGHHGFAGIEVRVVDAIAAFVAGR